jgi:two-component system, OmpR family, alkaline phosphatase synthesis response regulator PhoP
VSNIKCYDMINQDFTILLVDDEKDILEFLSYNLKKEQFSVFTAKSGKEAIEKAVKIKPHLIVLDVMMPEMDGIETCIELRKLKQTRDSVIIFLTARGEDYSQIAGLDAGADDYISKPVKPKVFLSKVNSLLRRSQKTPEEDKPEIIEFGDLKIDAESYMVHHGEKVISLPKKEFELLLLLTSKPNKVFTRDEIFSRIWGNDVIVGERTIDVHIRKIREKLNITNIKTIKGVGYKFEL